MRHFVKHKSKWTEIESILGIINEIANKKVVGVSKYSFMKHFEKDINYVFHTFCSNPECRSLNKIKAESGIKSFTCVDESCKTVSNVADAKVAFVTFDIETQVKELLEKYKSNLILPEKPLIDFPMSDIWNGQLHKDILETVKEPFISLLLNTDGVQIFKSNSTSLWPIIIILNNLPLDQRFKQDNMIIAGFHMSNDIQMSVFLESLAMEIQNINNQGGLELSSGKYKIFCPLSSLDAPAKSKLQNMKQYNGYFSCPYCTDKGEILNGCVKFSTRYVN
jgi:hypothetical protein